MEDTWFYAVAVGRQTGVFTSLSEAQSQVRGYSGAKWKKFASRRQAEEFVRLQGQSPPSLPPPPSPSQYFVVTIFGPFSGICTSLSTAKKMAKGAQVSAVSSFAQGEEFLGSLGMMVDPQGRVHADGSWYWPAYRRGMSVFVVPDPKKPDSLVAFCGGSAISNGQYNCHAAFVCIFPHNRAWDVVETVKGPFATSNRAEFLAVLEAFKRANIEDTTTRKTLTIYTESKLVVDSLSKWVIDWMYDGWVTSTGKPVKNRDLLQLLLEARGNNRGVSYKHVPAHTGGEDWESRWMEVVDQAATRAARAAAQNAAPVTSRPRICMMPAIGPSRTSERIGTCTEVKTEAP